MPHPERDEPLYSGNAGHGSRPLDILDPKTSSASLSTHPAASLRDFTSPPPEKLTPTISPSPPPSAINSTTLLPGLAGHGSRGPQEGLDADHLRAKSVRDIVPEGGGGEERRRGREDWVGEIGMEGKWEEAESVWWVERGYSSAVRVVCECMW
ncbi:hypothetical protein L211DRAFT_606274 [Terfezia boudieri ATCC MYA-4762]|uniref:Uncharacterized protein n=1 Tax=Terfezia boudieri ATCC MYA-4762 TaxID=1051890 RepID=A0A3N4M119_9PEZI|nr:hypothetical protein L211DRAFT_606274 [Terfezia boudieri ATCC MYA-4762]